MLDDSPLIIEPEKIHSYISSISWPNLVSMESYQVTLCNCPYKFDLFIWIVFSHLVKIFDKPLLPITYCWIVLNVFRTHIFLNRFGWIS